MARLPVFALAALVALDFAAVADAAPKRAPRAKAAHSRAKVHAAPKRPADVPVPWCAEELETLPNGLCHVDGGQRGGRRTLVVFLHGAIAKDVDWQWTQERALTRQAKASGFEAIFARAPLGPSGYVWPGTKAARASSEQELLDEWRAARRFLEARSGKRYDEVFLMGFSSGAYFTSSLALRGRGGFDGYAVFAGGSARADGAADVPTRAPVFVGVCAADKQTADHSRAFGHALAARGWPSRVDERNVGHMFSDVHVAHALAYLREAARSP